MSVLGHNVVLVRRDRGIVVEDARTGGFVSALDISTGMEGLTFNVARGWGWVDLRVGSPVLVQVLVLVLVRVAVARAAVAPAVGRGCVS